MHNKAELILEKWIADLADKDRTRAAVSGNFEELVDKWHRSKIPFDDAKELMPRAIKAHLPTDFVIKQTHKKLKSINAVGSLTDFETQWKDNIGKTGTSVFYSFYDIPGTETTEEKMYGSMSAMEYRKQQKYADSHPTLDWEKVQHEPVSIDNEEIFKDVDLDIDLGDL